jgi:hypothetical protein
MNIKVSKSPCSLRISCVPAKLQKQVKHNVKHTGGTRCEIAGRERESGRVMLAAEQRDGESGCKWRAERESVEPSSGRKKKGGAAGAKEEEIGRRRRRGGIADC